MRKPQGLTKPQIAAYFRAAGAAARAGADDILQHAREVGRARLADDIVLLGVRLVDGRVAERDARVTGIAHLEVGVAQGDLDLVRSRIGGVLGRHLERHGRKGFVDRDVETGDISVVHHMHGHGTPAPVTDGKDEPQVSAGRFFFHFDLGRFFCGHFHGYLSFIFVRSCINCHRHRHHKYQYHAQSSLFHFFTRPFIVFCFICFLLDSDCIISRRSYTPGYIRNHTIF